MNSKVISSYSNNFSCSKIDGNERAGSGGEANSSSIGVMMGMVVPSAAAVAAVVALAAAKWATIKRQGGVEYMEAVVVTLRKAVELSDVVETEVM